MYIQRCIRIIFNVQFQVNIKLPRLNFSEHNLFNILHGTTVKICDRTRSTKNIITIISTLILLIPIKGRRQANVEKNLTVLIEYVIQPYSRFGETLTRIFLVAVASRREGKLCQLL